jgi:tetratricopeptide (TPR) repeat protein
MKKIFISYNHKDEAWKDRLISHLKVLENEDFSKVWHDSDIGVGSEWSQKIEKAIDEADAAILIITANYLASNFIMNIEVPMLLERRAREGLKIFPIIMKPCAWQSIDWMNRLQISPRDGKPLSQIPDNDIDAELALLTRRIGGLFKKDKVEKVTGDDEAACKPLPPDAVYLAKLPITGPELFGREEELAMLDAAWEDNSTRVVTVVAWGGVGKTALINGWLNRMAKENYRGAARVYGWSFYSQGAAEGRQASADIFMHETLALFGDPDPQAGMAEEKGRRLANLVRQQKILLILDGLEPLQHPPHEAYGQEGRLKDQGLAVFLRQLAVAQLGLCVITSREPVSDLLNQTGSTVQEMNLEKLSATAGVALLKSLGVRGRDQEIKAAVKEYDGHALALVLLGNYISVSCGGDIRKRDTLPHLTDERRQGGHAKRVVAAYCNNLEGSPEFDILYLTGLFDRPADSRAIAVLRQPPAITGVTERLQNLSDEDWKYALDNLRKAHLLAKENPENPGSIDSHPLIREYVGERLSHEHSQGFKAAHERLFHYYKDIPEKELPDTLEEMAPLFAAITHGCAAGLHQSALNDVYWKRVQRGSEAFIVKKIGAFGSDLSALVHFFAKPWTSPAAGLTESNQAVVLNWAAFRLRAVGRLIEAVEPMQSSLEMRVEKEDWKHAAINASNLSELLLTLGRVAEAVYYGRKSVKYADRSGDGFLKMSSRTILAAALHQAGEREDAEALFREAEQIQKERQPGYPFLYSLRGYQYCDLLLDRGGTQKVLARAQQTSEWGKKQNWLLDIALDQLSIGRVYVGLAQELLQAGQKEEGEETRNRAGTFLQQAVDGLRQAGAQEFLVKGILARAAYFRELEEYEKAQDGLDEALEIAEAGAMKLHLVDYHLEAARLCLARKQKEEAAKHRDQAEKLIAETGFKRRLKDLDELK